MRRNAPRGAIWLIAILALLIPVFSVAASGPNWVLLDDTDGIRVWSLEIPGKEWPGFRGITTIDAPIDDIMHEILDVESQPEWAYGLREARVVKRIDDTRQIVYKRFERAGRAVARDLLMDIDHRYTPSRTAATVRFRTTDEVRVRLPRKTVRIPKLDGFYRLWQEQPGRTNVLYQVELDIGGDVPDDQARFYARKYSHDTLENLRSRIMTKRKRS